MKCHKLTMEETMRSELTAATAAAAARAAVAPGLVSGIWNLEIR
jgi:hypothetical protein